MILLPQEIENYISTNLDQPYNSWQAGTTYNANDMVIYKNLIYRSITNDNVGIYPNLNTGKWLLMAVDNAYASIDLHSDTATKIDDGLAFIFLTFSAVSFQYLAFGGVQGDLLTVVEKSSGGTILATNEYSIGTTRINANNWYDYYYLPIPDNNITGGGLPVDILVDKINTNTATIEVTLTKSTQGEAFIGSMCGGKGLEIGDTEYGLNINIVDYSRKETDSLGITTLVRKKSREIMTCDIVTPALHIQSAKRAVKNVLGTALMFIADPSTDSKFDNLITLGFIDKFQIYFDNGVITRSRMVIEEVL